jgi:capsular polysaccharide export protein
LDILFVSSRGSQYRYYQALSKVISMPSKVVTLLPGFSFKVFSSGLTLDVIKEGIDFHLERKKRKYKGVSPSVILWGCYVFFSALYFSLIYLKFKRYLGVYNPKIVCIWNGHRLPEMAIRAAAKDFNIRIAYFENGLLPNTTTMDFSGVNAFSSIPQSSQFYESYLHKNECISLADTSLLAREPHKRKIEVGVELACNYIFVPFQVNFDSQVIINSPWLNSMESFYEMLLSVVDEMDEKFIFAIKEHPSDPRSYAEFHNKHPRIKFVSGETEKLIRNSEAVVTLNSSVGIEAAMLEKKVIVLGNACYAINQMMLVVNSRKGLLAALKNLDVYEPNLNITRAFFTYLKNDYLLPYAWQDQISGVNLEHQLLFESKVLAAMD